jgi:hypothetical protein|tara:strand:+ start:331 stop:594 length:264 start_codon:yes stop_codon:yes gene_type:complete
MAMKDDTIHPCKQAYSAQLSLGISHYGIWSLSNPYTEDLPQKYVAYIETMKKAMEWELANNPNNQDSTILDRENLNFQHWSSKEGGS